MAKKNYYFNEKTIPDYVTVEGKQVPITGVFTSYRPRAMFCKCGYMLNCKDRGERYPTFDGYVCPECGRVHTETSVLNRFGWVGSTMEYFEYSYDGKKIHQKKIIYKLEEQLTNMFNLQKTEETRIYSFIEADRQHAIPHYFKNELRTTYADLLHPMMKVLLDAELDNNLNYGYMYYGRLDIVQDVYDSNPQLLVPILNSMYNEPVSYAVFEGMYPEYLLPLTAKLIRDMHWSKTHPWHKIGEYSNLEAVTCVVSYYKSGLISFSQMRNLLDKVDALRNPCFVRSFKANYLQMENYIEDLKADGVNVSNVIFDVKDYYHNKSRKFFINYGLTPTQVNDAFAGAKDGLDLLITLGSTRRKKMK